MRRLSFRPFLVLSIAAAALVIAASLATASPAPRIINGATVTDARKAEMWPFLVSLGTKGQTARASHSCGGALLSRTLVLTAAHCFDSVDEDDGQAYRTLPSTVTALAGTPVLSSERAGQRRGVKDIFFHPRWNPKTFANDIAIVRLATPVTFNDKVKPVTVVTADHDAWWGAGAGLAESAATGAWAAGWGNVVAWDTGEAYPNALREVSMPIQSDAECSDKTDYNLGQHFCAGLTDSDNNASNGTTGRDTCQGDSGGPIMVGDGAGAWQQVGIVSYGELCGATTLGAYTRLPSYRAWLALPLPAGAGPGGIRAVPSARMVRSFRSAVTLAWGAAAGGAKGYAVYVEYSDGTLGREAVTAKRAAMIRGLEPDSSYVFYVAARNAAGNEGPLRKVGAYTLP